MNIKIQNDNNYIPEEKKITPLIVKSETKKWYIHTLLPNLDNRNIDFVTDKVYFDPPNNVQTIKYYGKLN